MSGLPDRFLSDDVLRQAINIREIKQLELLTNRARMLKENPVEALRTVARSRPSMTERALMALEAYGRFGLTVRELYEKRKIWLFFPDDGPEWTSSVKAVSMLLRRLNHRLADREKEGREWRYRINNGGCSRLAYYRRVREDARLNGKRERAENPRFNEPNLILEKNHKILVELIARYNENPPTLESSSEPSVQVSFKTYFHLRKLILEMAGVMYTAQAALASGDPALREAAFSKCTKGLTNLKKTQELLLTDVHAAKGSLLPVK